ncbi:hypothetical protein LBMAG53_37440 [Planctomycetota bacterium]|nr:hypothetical protein LBMAG53_37440 [Planctomycetota bacterium]
MSDESSAALPPEPAVPTEPTRTTTPIASQRLGDMVADRIKDYIIERKLSEGDRLPTEQQFAEMFGVSRLSVREATRALGFLGILRSAPKRGLTIGRVDMDRVSTFLGFHLAMSDYPRTQLLKARMVIESGALAEAVERIATDDAVYQRLCALNDRLAGITDVDAFIAGDLAFHQALLASSQVGPLIAFGGLLEVFFRSFREELVHLRPEWAGGIESHRAILAALRDRNLNLARALLEAHLSRYFSRV